MTALAKGELAQRFPHGKRVHSAENSFQRTELYLFSFILKDNIHGGTSTGPLTYLNYGKAGMGSSKGGNGLFVRYSSSETVTHL